MNLRRISTPITALLLAVGIVSVGVAPADAVDACGGVQRRLLGLPEVRLRPGDVADVAVFDSSWQPRRTLVGGREHWRT